MDTTSFLPPPSWPLERQRAIGADSDPVAIWNSDPIWADARRKKLGLPDPAAKYEHYWKRDELPPLYAAAVLFQDRATILGIADAKKWLQAALDSLAAKGTLWVAHVQVVKAPSYDGNTFRIVYGVEGRTEGRLASSLGISADDALHYVAADYIEHRFLGDVILQPFVEKPRHWTLVLCESVKERRALHTAFVPRVFV